VSYPLEVHDFFGPRGDFVACGSCGLVEVYYAVAYVLGGGSFAGFMSIRGVGGVLCFGECFACGFPWRGCSRHVCFSLKFRKRRFEVLRVYIGSATVFMASSLPSASSS